MNLVARRQRTGPVWALGFAASVVAVGLITLTPRGTGWAWGSPLAEARWYLTGLDDPVTTLELAGNLLLLVVPFGLAAVRWPALGRIRLLAALSLSAGCSIEFLQWALPIGRVVSPLDAVLNATGAVAAGLAVTHGRAMRAHRRLLPEEYVRNLSRPNETAELRSRREIGLSHVPSCATFRWSGTDQLARNSSFSAEGEVGSAV